MKWALLLLLLPGCYGTSLTLGLQKASGYGFLSGSGSNSDPFVIDAASGEYVFGVSVTTWLDPQETVVTSTTTIASPLPALVYEESTAKEDTLVFGVLDRLERYDPWAIAALAFPLLVLLVGLIYWRKKSNA